MRKPVPASIENIINDSAWAHMGMFQKAIASAVHLYAEIAALPSVK